MRQLQRFFLGLFVFLPVGVIAATGGSSPVTPKSQKPSIHCPSNSPNCADIARHLQLELGFYSGHDEPAIAFYSNHPGSGNSITTNLTIPTDPPAPPQQNGSGGTFNFQLHPAFWFGMVLCDTQSAPNFTNVCNPDTDANIFDNPNPNARDFIGHHPGSAFLEMQFYPPGGLNTCSDPVHWCVAMVIFSFNAKDVFTQFNNQDCQNKVGVEPDNFAFLTTNGISEAFADPLNLNGTPNPLFNTVPGQQFLMDPGDEVRVSIHDTAEGLRVEVRDFTSGGTGSMTASIANGFAQVNFVPDPDPANPSVTCSSTPYAFHPQFATTSEHTRAVWTAHAFNVGISDEIGHYELCSAVSAEGGTCLSSAADPAPDFDDSPCFSGSFLASLGLQPIGACLGEDLDFDGTSYNLNWPGTGDLRTDALIHPSAIRFTSPQFHPQRHSDYDDRGLDDDAGLRDFSRVAFETDIVISEIFSNPNCDIFSGSAAGCTVPPTGANFYPIYSTTRRHHDREDGVCSWQLGGPDIPGTEDNFGGSSTTEYANPLFVFFPAAATPASPNGTIFNELEDFRRVIPHNPCGQNGDDGRDE